MDEQPRQVPVNTPLITEDDIESVVTALRDGWVSGEGPIVAEFENSFAQSCNLSLIHISEPTRPY